jgi:hypothetical protein
MSLIPQNRRASSCLLFLALVFAAATASAQANFTLSAAPGSLAVVQGGQTTAVIITTISGGFDNSISLAASGAPVGVGVTFNPPTIPAPGAGTSTMTFSVFRLAKVGTYPITITATAGAIKQTATISLTITAPGLPSFTVAASPASLAIPPGNQAATTISTTISGGFNSGISLTATGMPTDTTVGFNPSTIPAPGAGTSIMTVTVGGDTAAGVYGITVTASGGGVWQTTAVILTVPTFTVSSSPSSLTVAPGNQGTSNITTVITAGFNSPISLSDSGAPSTTNVSFNPSTIPAPGAGTSIMTIIVGNDTPVGTYPITVTASGGGQLQTVLVTLTVASAGFSLNTSQTSFSIPQNVLASGVITTRITAGFNSSIQLSSSGAPIGMLVGFHPNKFSAPGVGNAMLTISAMTKVQPGTYTVTISAIGGGVKQTVDVTIEVTPQLGFTLTASPAALNIVQGSAGNSSITSAISGGFDSSISLSASGMPAGVAVRFDSNSMPAPGTGNTPMAITVAANTPVGTYPISVTGNGGGIQQSTTLTLNVNPAGALGIDTAYFLQSYSYTLPASFGKPPYSYQLVYGSLPPGLAMDQSGNLTGAARAVGQFPFSVQVTDSSQPPQQQTLNFSLPVVVGTDIYGGFTAAPVPGCISTNYFQEMKVNGRWILATPSCNSFYQKAIYEADSRFISQPIMDQRYGNDKSRWATHTLQRAQSYGFNSADIFYSTYILPVGTWGGQQGASIQIPFVLYYPALGDVVGNPGSVGLPEPIKNICRGQDQNGYLEYCLTSIDVFDPKWQQGNSGELSNQINEYTGGFNTDPWVLAISLGDASEVFPLTGNGAGTNGAHQYPHAAMLIATANFRYSGYLDNTLYSKYAWANYLQKKYGTIAALNASWNTGNFYTSFGDAGGFGTGTGVLDEDGRHPWFGTDQYHRYFTLVGVNSNLVADLDAFLYQYAYQAYAVQTSTIRSYDTNHLLVCGTYGGVGDGGTRPAVLQALKDAGCNLFVWAWNPYDPATALNSNQAAYDVIGLPAVVWYGTSSQMDSVYHDYPYPKYGAPFGDFSSQVTRGQDYGPGQQLIFTSQATNGDYYVMGSSFWGLTDNTSEKANWGLFTLLDNAYDGQCAVVAQGTDQWGIACGGEATDYGNYLDSVTQGNSGVTQHFIQALLQP